MQGGATKRKADENPLKIRWNINEGIPGLSCLSVDRTVAARIPA
jgi:hypothetical protein